MIIAPEVIPDQNQFLNDIMLQKLNKKFQSIYQIFDKNVIFQVKGEEVNGKIKKKR